MPILDSNQTTFLVWLHHTTLLMIFSSQHFLVAFILCVPLHRYFILKGKPQANKVEKMLPSVGLESARRTIEAGVRFCVRVRALNKASLGKSHTFIDFFVCQHI